MIKVNKGKIEIAGTADTIAAEVGNLLRHIFPTIAEHDRIEAAAAFNVAGKAMADAAEDLVENFQIGLDALNMRNEIEDEEEDDDPEENEDEDMMREFLDTLSHKELKSLLEIIEKFDEYAEEEEDD